jgi:23S rRNA pseudouridine1911/1915/1917 synthase
MTTDSLTHSDAAPSIITDDMAGWRLDRALAALVPTLSRERIKALISSGNCVSGAALSRDPSLK